MKNRCRWLVLLFVLNAGQLLHSRPKGASDIVLPGRAGKISGIALQTQLDTFPAVFKVYPENGSAYMPIFSPLCPNRCWLDGKEFDLPSRKFVDTSCIPISAIRLWHGASITDLKPFRLQWKADPFEPKFLWTSESRPDQNESDWLKRVDTLVIWRYDLEKAKQDAFLSLIGIEIGLGKAGIWVVNNKELALLDRYSGQIIARAPNPNGPGIGMRLQPWGNDLLITDQLLFRTDKQVFTPFFPLPADQEGCVSPKEMEIEGELCLSLTRTAGNVNAYYLFAPGLQALRLPFEPHKFSYQNYILAVNPPLAWLCTKDTLIGFDFSNGSFQAYPGSTANPLYGQHEGRFLGFYSELGLSFFDKNSCQFRALPLPYGTPAPRHFTSDQRYIYLSYQDHWEIVDFDQLEPAFGRSTLLEEYAGFEKKWQEIGIKPETGFYSRYADCVALYQAYRQTQNPKIRNALHYLISMASNAFYSTPDSLMGSIAEDYARNRFDSAFNCQIATGLFNYYAYQGQIEKASTLLQGMESGVCDIETMEESAYKTQILKTILFRLDSLDQISLSPDARLFATGKIWIEYCLQKRNFMYAFDPRPGLEQAYVYFRQLLLEYPDSPMADEAAYELFYYIDYVSSTTDDETPDGDLNAAYLTFRSYLSRYPGAQRRAEVLFRLAKVIANKVKDGAGNEVPLSEALEFIQILEKEYPEFVKNQEDFEVLNNDLKWKAWSAVWLLQLKAEQETYSPLELIRFRVSLRNLSRIPQTLDTVFISAWQQDMRVHLHVLRDKNCEPLWGDFPLILENLSTKPTDITLQPGESYTATFQLGRNSMNKNDKPGSFSLAQGETYLYNMSSPHPRHKWLWMNAVGGRFEIK